MATIEQRVTVTAFKVVRVALWLEDGALRSVADIRLYNELGQQIGDDHVEIPWSAGEEEAILANLAAKRSAYGTAHGWSVYVPEVEE